MVKEIFVEAVCMSEMPDSTKELLSANHAAVLRELDHMRSDVVGRLQAMSIDMASQRQELAAHSIEDNRRFGGIERGLSRLQGAYLLGATFFAGILIRILFWGKP